MLHPSPSSSVRNRWMLSALGAATVALLAACGGGSATTNTEPTQQEQQPTAQPFSLSGTVATGAAFTGSTVSVYDRTGALVGTSSAVGENGSFTVTVDAAAQAPFVLVATRTGASGETESLYSVAPSAGEATVNVTPITSLVAALLSPTGHPQSLVQALSSQPTLVSSDTIAASVQKVATLLAPALAATGVSNTVNPFSTPITTNGSGYDRLLDTLQITITPSASASHIEVGFRVAQADAAAQPPVIQFTSNADLGGSGVTAQITAAAAAVTANTLVPDGTSARIAALLSELTACYALPLTSRVDTAVNDSTAATGTAANVVAPACRTVFTGGDPANYLSNGARVGRDASNSGAFAGLFRPGATGVVFSQGTYEFTRANGDIVIAYKTRDTTGSETLDSLVVRLDNTSNQLRVIGNQYAYPGGVSAYHQRRQFVTADSTGASQSAYDYYSSGYSFGVNNWTNGQGQPIFNRVEVTSPRGNVLTLKPSSGYSLLNLVKGNGTITGTSYLRLRSAYIDSNTAGHPSAVDTSLFFALNDYSDEQLSAIPQQSVWKFDYFLAGNTGSTPDATQHYKTRARALSLAELHTKGLAELTPGTLASLVGGDKLNSQIKLPVSGPLTGLAYNVSGNALPPTQLKLYGRLAVNGALTGQSFDDAGNVASAARSGTIGCSLATNADAHCGSSGAYASTAYMNGLHLWSRDVAGREYAQFYAFYRLH